MRQSRVAEDPALVGEDKLLGFGLQSAGHPVGVVLTSADGTKECHRGRPVLQHMGYVDKVFMDIQTNEKCGIMLHG